MNRQTFDAKLWTLSHRPTISLQSEEHASYAKTPAFAPNACPVKPIARTHHTCMVPENLLGGEKRVDSVAAGLAHPRKLEPVWPAVFLLKPRLAISEPTGDTAAALGRVGAVKERNVLVADVAEPKVSESAFWGICRGESFTRTSEYCSSPGTTRARCYELGRPPISRRRSRPPYPGG